MTAPATTAKAIARSPLAPASFPNMPVIAGVRVGTGQAGIRYRGRSDTLVVELAKGTSAAGVFTLSKTASAPVLWCKALVPGTARGLVANAGNSNAFTGAAGVEAVHRTVRAAAAALGCKDDELFIASTGLIGQPLPVDKLEAIIPLVVESLSETAWDAAADAIRTTDTFLKGATATASIGKATVSINGIAKGSGMIAPDLGTMFAFVFTDARIPAPVLQRLVKASASRSFNAITVDSDTSTSDTVLLFATGKGARHPVINSAADPKLAEFREALDAVMLDLAQQIVRDGEGATKFVTVNVSGARNAEAARKIGLSIANSPLVKTAVAGEDPNWGRIVAAVGKSGEEADRDRLTIAIGPYPVAEHGGVRADYVEAPGAAYMKNREIEFHVDVGVGRGKFTVYTCDLTNEYIRINAAYRS